MSRDTRTFVVLHEEPYLAERFGESCDRYRAAVRRSIPGAAYRARP